ncbi:RES family NAD+ phosphorylase [Streptomyces sp. NPDC001927]
MTNHTRPLIRFDLDPEARLFRVYPRVYKGVPGKPAWYCDGAKVCRYDLPKSGGTCYTASSPEGALIEVFRPYLGVGIPLARVEEMFLALMYVIDLHHLADLTINANYDVMGISYELVHEVDENYPLSRDFARTARDEGFDGVHWKSLRDMTATRTNFALFAEISGNHEDKLVTVEHRGPIPREVVDAVAAEFRIPVLDPPADSYPVTGNT